MLLIKGLRTQLTTPYKPPSGGFDNLNRVVSKSQDMHSWTRGVYYPPYHKPINPFEPAKAR